MIHTIHEKQMSKKNKMDYLLENSNFLHDYYSAKPKQNNFFDKTLSREDKEKQRYLKSTGNHIEIERQSETCCGRPRQLDEGFLYCVVCGIQSPYIEHTRTYDEHIVPVYSKLSHFRKIVRQLHGTENFKLIKLPEIKAHIDKYKITDLSVASIKHILKRLKLSTYYDHIQLIRLHLGCEIIPISPELEEELTRLFIKVENQYPALTNRSNFFNYNYLLNKFFIHLNRPEYIPYLATIKGQDKINDSDRIFRKIKL